MNSLPSSNWKALELGLLVPATAVPGDRYAEEEARRVLWCNCSACAAAPKHVFSSATADERRAGRLGRFFSSLAGKVEHGFENCTALMCNRGYNYDFVAVAAGADCLVLRHKKATRGGHSLCERCLDEAIEYESWAFDAEDDDATVLYDAMAE